MRIGSVCFLVGCLFTLSGFPARGEDWPQFRGPGLSGRSPDTTLPTKWSDTENLGWKAKLPGPGSSSPIAVGKKVFVTCYSGYGAGGSSDEQKNLRRHLVCVDAESGKELWSKSVAPVLPEDNFRGFLAQHGYATGRYQQRFGYEFNPTGAEGQGLPLTTRAAPNQRGPLPRRREMGGGAVVPGARDAIPRTARST